MTSRKEMIKSIKETFKKMEEKHWFSMNNKQCPCCCCLDVLHYPFEERYIDAVCLECGAESVRMGVWKDVRDSKVLRIKFNKESWEEK